MARHPEAEIIAVGSEMLTPFRVETNSLFLTRMLNRLGIEVGRKSVVGDEPEMIGSVLESALRKADIVLLSGGLGPTTDDLTREAVSRALGRELELDEGVLEALRQRYARAGLRMTENNRRQAMVPNGAQVLENPNGTAPGLFLKEGKALIFLLPGPPRELEPMADQVLALICQHKRTSRQHCRQLRVASAAESHVDFKVSPIYRDYREIETTILSSPGVIDLFFRWKGEPESGQAEPQLDELVGKVKDSLGESVFAECDLALEEVVGGALRTRGLTLATAESCTGGLVGKLITDVPGSSACFAGGIVCYSNQLKRELVGVREETLLRHGAVSRETAGEMARGVRRRLGADLGLALTGIAGPGGGSEEKQVGLVYVALSRDTGTRVLRLLAPGPREAVRLRAARRGLDLVRRALRES